MDTEVATRGFNYSGLPQAFVKESRKRGSKIIALDRTTAENILETGRLLLEQRNEFGSLGEKTQRRGNDTWNAWVIAECGWSDGKRHAARIIKMYQKFGVGDSTTPHLGYEIMKQLSSDTTPQEVVDEVIKLAKEGKLPTIKKVRDMKKAAQNIKEPTPTDAKQKAMASGEPVLGSDGKIYTPLPDEEVEAYQERRDAAYSAIDAIAAINNLPEAGAWLRSVEEHWLSDLTLGKIEIARKWLAALEKEYRKKEKVIDGN